METRININYTPSGTSEVFGTFTISFQGIDGQIRSVDTKFNPKQLWEFSRDTTSVAFDLAMAPKSLGTPIAESIPMMTTATMISTKVNPFSIQTRFVFVLNLKVVKLLCYI